MFFQFNPKPPLVSIKWVLGSKIANVQKYSSSEKKGNIPVKCASLIPKTFSGGAK